MADSISLATRFREQNALPNVLTRGQAILYSQSVRFSWRRPALQSWNEEREGALLDDAVRLILAGEVERARRVSEEWRNSYRRAGEIFEWLYRSSSSQPQLYAVISAACYQVAGYPALATGILSNLPPADGQDLFHQAVRSYISADFLKVTSLISQILTSDGTTPELWIGNEICRTLMVISASLLTNSELELREAARQRLNVLLGLAARKLPAYLWLLVRLLSNITDHFSHASVYNVNSLSELLSEEGQDFLQQYCFKSCIAGRSLLWPAQVQGIRKLIAENSFVLATPTGSGKTSVAFFSIIRFLFAREAEHDAPGLCLYLVPSRALANEAEGKLAEIFTSYRQPRVTITGLYGGTDWGLFDAWLSLDKHTILICTVEKADAILRYLGRILLQRLNLVILDEAHHVNLNFLDAKQTESLISGENRAARVETFVSRIRTLKPDCPVVGLSAVAGGIQDHIARWLTGRADATALTGDTRSTRQLIGTLGCKRDGSSTIFLNFLNGRTLELSEDREAAYFHAPFETLVMRGLSPYLATISGFLRLHAFWAAIHLGLAGKLVLVSTLQRIQNDLKVLAELMTTRWSNLSENLVSAECAGSATYRDCVQACIDFCGPSSYETTLLRRGIAVHHGQLPMRVRRLMTDVIAKRLVKITVATSTLTEGVNLPFDVVILPSFVRMKYDGERTQSTNMAVSEFLNLAGRAGRPGLGSEGITLILKAEEVPGRPGTQGARDQARPLRTHTRNYAGFMTEITQSLQSQSTSPLEALLHEIYTLWAAVSNQLDANAFFSWLEQTIPVEDSSLHHALDVLDSFLNDTLQASRDLTETELSASIVEELAQRLWQCTYAAVFSAHKEFYEKIFVVRSSVLTDIYDEDELRLSYSTGISPGRIDEFNQLYAAVISLLENQPPYDSLQAAERVSFFEEIATLLQNTNSFRLKATNHVEVLRWWLRHPDAIGPDPEQLRDWLKTVNEDLIFRMSATIGSILARRWSERRAQPDQLPNLATWQEDTQLPWVSFWIRELLAWGTTDPVEAYLFAAGAVADRATAIARSENFREWAAITVEENQTLSPVSIRSWLRGDAPEASSARPPTDSFQLYSLEADLPPQRHLVFPSVVGERIHWLEPAGQVLGQSLRGDPPSEIETEAIYYLDPVGRSVRRVDRPPR